MSFTFQSPHSKSGSVPTFHNQLILKGLNQAHPNFFYVSMHVSGV